MAGAWQPHGHLRGGTVPTGRGREGDADRVVDGGQGCGAGAGSPSSSLSDSGGSPSSSPSDSGGSLSSSPSDSGPGPCTAVSPRGSVAATMQTHTEYGT